MKKCFVLLFSMIVLAACQRDLCAHRQELMEKSLYFQFDSDEIQSKDIADLTEGAKFLTDHRFRRVHLDGFADEQGGRDSEYNKELSYRRAQKVKDFLVEHGVTERYITITGNGTLSGIPNWQKRRVDVTIK